MAIEINEQNESQRLDKFLAVTWILWHRRNKWLYDNLREHPNSAIEYALAFQQSFSDIQSQRSSTYRTLGKWCKPPTGFLKLNINGALFFIQKNWSCNV